MPVGNFELVELVVTFGYQFRTLILGAGWYGADPVGYEEVVVVIVEFGYQ